MAHSLSDLSSAGSASKDMKQQLMTAIRHDQKDQVLQILRREDEPLSGTELMQAVRCAVHFQNKEILLTLIRNRCYLLFWNNFHLQTWKDSLSQESNQKDDGGEIFWVFDTLYKEGEKALAMHVAAVFPEKILTNQKTWPEVVPAIDAWVCFCFEYFIRAYMMSRLDALAGEPSLTSLKQWCVENCYVNMAFYLAAVTKDWKLFETMARTQTSRPIHPELLYQVLKFVSKDTRADDIRGCSAVVSVLKNYPLNDDNIHLFPICQLDERVTKACEDQGLLEWSLLFSSDLAYIKRHYKNCHNQGVLNRILEGVVCYRQNEWEFVIELLPRCSDIKTLTHVLRHAFCKGRIDVAKEVMSRVDPSTMMARTDLTLLFETVACRARNRSDATRHLVRLCIASGLSTFQRSLNCPWDVCFFFPMDEIPKLRIIKLLVESGTFTHGTLCELSSKVQSMLSSQTSEEEKKYYRCIQEAAATPCSLQHLARLTISHSIGCQPGRSERIQSLPLPNKLKLYVRFRDVLTADTQFNKKSKD